MDFGYSEEQRLIRRSVAELMSDYDRDGDGVGIAANSAKVATSNAAYEAANHGMQTFGGWSVTEEYDINRLWRDARFFQIGPVSNELAKTFIAERELGLPKSY